MLIRGYSDVSVTRSGIRNDLVCDLKWGVYFKFDTDIRKLFPYINGTVKGAQYYHQPLHIRFNHNGVKCTLYPVEAMAAPFRARDYAFGFIEDLIVFLNDLYNKRHDAQASHKIRRQPASVVDIIKALPRNNCKKCGYATCMAFAAALREGKVDPGNCPDFAKPISVYTVYPAFDQDGMVESTFVIETNGIMEKQFTVNNDNPTSYQEDTELKRKTRPLCDQYGIPIQNGLTSREIQVLRLIAEGSSNPEISGALNISPHTVKSHVIHIFNKLSVNDRTQAAVWATRNQII